MPPGAREIRVNFEDGSEYYAMPVGVEERNNVTLIKIDAQNLPFLPLGSSSDVAVGDLAFTIANPYDCVVKDRQTAVSMGVVSGIYRLRGDGDYTGKVIETDAALNNGSDGGPLVNMKGEIIGILNLSYSYTKWLNVAVPIDQIKYILEDLKEGKKIYPRYGFIVAEEAEPGGGVAITKISRGGPAQKAGLKKGDIILEVDELKIDRPDRLLEELAIMPPGSVITLVVRRGNDEMVVRLVSSKIVRKGRKFERGSLGMTVDEYEDELVISRVVEGSAADEAGIQPEDRLLQVQGRKVTTIKEVAEIVRNYFAGDTIELVVERDGKRIEVKLVLKKKK